MMPRRTDFTPHWDEVSRVHDEVTCTRSRSNGSKGELMVNPTIEHDVKDLSLAEEGKKRIEWAEREMPVLG